MVQQLHGDKSSQCPNHLPEAIQHYRNSTVNCPVIDPSVSNTRSACSGGSKPSTLHMANSASANVTAYFFAEYSLDGGTNWSTLVANQAVAADSSESATVNVPMDNK